MYESTHIIQVELVSW